MPDKDMAARIAELEDELAQMKAVVDAGEDFRRQIEERPYGLDRLRRVQRKTGYRNDEENDDDD